MPKVICIIQARMGSTRLPGKSLKDFGGTTLVESVHAGASIAKSVSEVVIAIPETSLDDELFDFLSDKNLNVVRGSEGDLISRHLHVASRFKADFIVRIPGDNPLPHGSEIDRIIDFHLQANSGGFSTNLSEVFESGYPDGIGAEIFSRNILEEIANSKTSMRQQEHLHLNFFDYENQTEISPNAYPVRTVRCPEYFARPDIVLDVNTNRDFEYFRTMFRDLGTIRPHIQDIIPWHDQVGFLLR